jgi:hypothetical protein
MVTREFTFCQTVPMMQAMSGSSTSMTVRALRGVDLSGAQSVLAVANSPLFILRKLREDPTTAKIAGAASGHAIFNLLKTSLRRNPRTLRSAVAPYVYVVALSMQRDIKYLRQASRIHAPYPRWFKIVCAALLDSYQAATVQTVTVPGVRKTVPAFSSDSANLVTISLDK